MNFEDPIGIIELGNKILKCLIFKIKENKDVEILSTAITSSNGIDNDVIVNLLKASNAIRSCISTAEKKAKISLKKINVVFEQPEFLCTRFSKHKKIDGSKIKRYDIEFLLNEAKKQLILNDKNQFIIHIFNHNYVVDGKIFIEEPINVFADNLSHEITFITTPKNSIKNINQAFIDCDIEIDKFISRTFALGVNLFNFKELQFGSALINLESKKVSLGLFKNLALSHSVTLPIGTDHITKDISQVCSLNLDESEKIRNSIDFSFQNNQSLFDKNNYLSKNYFLQSQYRKISKDLILDVVKARLDEIFKILKKQLIVPNLNLNSGINFLLASEDSKLFNLESYCTNFFGLIVKTQNDNNIKNQNYPQDNFDSSFGALKIIKDGWETEAIPEMKDKNVKKIGFFSKIFGNF